MAKILDKDPATYERERDTFLKDLLHFHETRGTPIKRPPKINGNDIDLYLLYVLVTGRGGWYKVNTKNEWDTVQESFNIPRHCINSGVALKQIYLRYLDRYEKVHFLGEIGERSNDEDEDSRHRRWSARALHSVPLTYNQAQHNVCDNLRSYNGLSTNLYKPTDYDRLALSLISPLPNEQDFAINVCTLLSNEGKHTLKLDKHPSILHFLLGHAAVFNHSSTREIFMEQYNKVRGHSMMHFWQDVIDDSDLTLLLDESRFLKRKKKILCFAEKGSLETADQVVEKQPEAEVVAVASTSDVVMREEGGLRIQPEDKELFCLGRTLGTQDYFGQRVLQIAMILRNLSFTDENVEVMGKDITFLRFILLCCSSQWNSLHQMGLDMLANVASEIALSDLILDPMLNVITKGLESQDRAIALSCVEVLNKLGQNERNEELLLRCLEDKVYQRICELLTLQDIMMLVHTLECLYSLSSLGERSCNSIVRVHGALDTLVSLLTVEAQSYGPKACVLMRVVETVSTTGPISVSSTSTTVAQSSAATTVASSPAVASSATSTTTTSSTLSSVPLPTPAIARLVASPIPQNMMRAPSPIQPAPAAPHTPVHHAPVPVLTAPISTPTLTTQRVMVPVTSSTQQVAQENEQFALGWLRSTFEPVSGSRIEQGELYKQYITSCAKIGRRGVIAPNHFPRCVRTAFGMSVGPKQSMAGETALHHYEGIQVRGKPTTTTTATSTVPSSTTPSLPPAPLPPPTSPAPATPPPATANSSTQLNALPPSLPISPILKAQLCAPPKPNTTPTKKETKSKVVKVSAHPHLSQALLGGGNAGGARVASVPTGSLPSTSALPTSTSSSPSPAMTATIAAGTVTVTSTSSATGGIPATMMTSTNMVTSSAAPPAPAAVSTSVATAMPGDALSSSSTSLIKSLLANKVGDLVVVTSTASTASSSSPATPQGPQYQLTPTSAGFKLVDRSHFEQVTQRQQQQRLLQQQQTTAGGNAVQVQAPVGLVQVRSPPSSTTPPTAVSTHALAFVNSSPKFITTKPIMSRINGVRSSCVKQIEAIVEAKIQSAASEMMQCDTINSNSNNVNSSSNSNSSNNSTITTNSSSAMDGVTSSVTPAPSVAVTAAAPAAGTATTATVTENHVGSVPISSVQFPPPLASLSTAATRMVTAGTTTVVAAKPYPNTRLDMEDSDSTGNNSLASSSGMRDNCSATGGEENENSLTSFEGFLNGVPHSLDVDDTTSKDSAPKSLMLADLLEKTVEKNEPPVLNGSLRLGERGLELSPPPPPPVKRPVTPITDHRLPAPIQMPVKRPANDASIEPDAKRVHVNGDASPDEPPEEGSVSSTAANLYAALAADVAGEEDMEDEPIAPPQPLIMTTSSAPRQILVAAGGQIALPQRVAVMGQHYVVAQPQTALVQGQTQTVLVAQTQQQQGTGTKTIIILQPQSQQQSPQQSQQHQKVIVQRLQSPPPPPLMPTSMAMASASQTTLQTIASKQSLKMVRSPMPSAQSAPTTIVTSHPGHLPHTQVITHTIVSSHMTHSPINTHTQVMAHSPLTHTQVVAHPVVSATHMPGQIVTHSSVPTLTHNAAIQNSIQAAGMNTVVQSHMATGHKPIAKSMSPLTIRSHIRPVAPAVHSSATMINNSADKHAVTLSTSTATPTVITSVVTHTSNAAAGTTSAGTVSSSSSSSSSSVLPPATATATTTVPTASPAPVPVVQQGHFLCEWRGCMRNFKSANEVYMHACESHCPSGSQEIQCLWERCDAMKRKRFSLMTHLYDRHCNADVLRMMAVRRKQLSVTGRSEIPAPSPPTPHPGYAPNAAFHAIKRHALEFVNPKELQDDNEGPVTKSIRLTSALILRNLVIYSTYGRRYLTSYEPHLASVALSNVESSRTIAQVLFDMSQPR